ncbi:hypothetical protein D3C81_2064220 [compost metagenome]|uniref:Uncharacterized protein n=1 Tax=Cupriavidus campinensis TaxID=151783 RepID=A0ABY3EMJ7_9BURK|nr:hypothetical protein FGG12_14405 [Cupriavidus campinensis]
MSIAPPGTNAENDGNQRLQDKTHPARARETLRQLLKKLVREEIDSPGLERLAHGRRQRSYEDQYGDDSQDSADLPALDIHKASPDA